MEYTILELANLAGITTRTLRHYDNIGLLHPAYHTSSGYRVYTQKEVDLLYQILIYKYLGLELSKIKEIVSADNFEILKTLKQHLNSLEEKQLELNLMITSIKKTIQSKEENIIMKNEEKFEAFKKGLIEENEQKYGAEIREKYGDKKVAESNRKMMNLSKEQYEKMNDLAIQINTKLEEAVKLKMKPDSEEGKQIASMHKKWLSYTWSTYSREAHIGLVNMYLQDERFKSFYDKNVDGCAEFLKQAVETMN